MYTCMYGVCIYIYTYTYMHTHTYLFVYMGVVSPVNLSGNLIVVLYLCITCTYDC